MTSTGPTRSPELRILLPEAIERRAPPSGWPVHLLGGETMGTTWSVRFAAPASTQVRPIDHAIALELERVVAQMSPWRPDSDINRFNEAAAGTWHVLPEPFFSVLQYAMSVARDSEGAFDPTAGALVNAWGFGPTGRYDQPGFGPPGEARIEAARAASGWHRLEIDDASRRARQPGGLRLDLSATAKGHAVDRIALRLAHTFRLADVLVDVGGELRGAGLKPDGQPWWVDVEALPDGPAPPGERPTPGQGAAPRRTRIALHGLCVATSGDHRRYFMRAGLRHSHTIDPRNGWPIAHGLCSVTVLHASCMAADALSTALMVLGPHQGLRFARRNGLAAIFVQRQPDGALHEFVSPALQELAAGC